MTEVIGVRFKQVGKIYYFSPNGVPDAGGGKGDCRDRTRHRVRRSCHQQPAIKDEGIIKPLKTVIRVANKDDLRRIEENKVKKKRRSSSAWKRLRSTSSR